MTDDSIRATAEAARAPRAMAVSTLVSLGALTLLGPFTTDAFLPALPQIADELHVGSAEALLALSGITVGIAIGMLFIGPISDGVGRRRPLLIGSTAMAVSALGAAAAPNLVILVAWCVAMGLSVSIGMVLGRAVVSDTVDGPRLVSTFAILGTLTSVGPVISPIAGVAVMTLWGWRAIFVTLAVMSALVLLALLTTVPESLPPGRRQRRTLRSFPRNAVTAFRSRPYLAGATVIWFGFIVMWAYISGSAFIIQSVLGMSAVEYSVDFGVNGIGLILAGIMTARLSHRMRSHDIVAIGLGLQAVAAVALIVAIATGMFSPWVVFPAFFLIASSLGFIFGPATEIALRELRHVAGTALAVLGVVQFAFAGAVSPLVASGGSGNPVPFAAVIGTGSALAWIAWGAFRSAAR